MAGIDTLIKLTPELLKYVEFSKYANTSIGEKIVEVVIRDTKGKFVSFAKCLLPELTQTAQNQITQMTSNVFLNSFSAISTASSLANNVQTELARRAVKEVGRDVKKVLNGVNALKNMSWVTMGLSAANIGISVAGFAVMNQKLNAMDQKLIDIQAKVTTMSKQVDDIHRMNINANFFKPLNIISLKSRQITSKLVNGEKVSREEINDLLQDICINVRSFLTLTYIIPIEDMLEILYTVLPVAVNMINLYYAEYYEFTGENGHPLHSTLLQLLQDCSGDTVRKQIEDRYYLEKGCHGKTVDSIVACHELICKDLQMKMEDTFLLRKGCDTKELFDELNEVTSKLAAAMATDFVPVIAQEQGTENAVKILNTAAEETLGLQVAAMV